MARKTNHISILQFDERLLSLLRVRRSARGVDVLDAQVERGNWSASDGSLAAALKEFARRHGVANDTICTVLPRHDMTARMITLPSQSEEEVAGMVRLAAMEHVPYPPEELVIDQCVIQRLSDGQARVFAVFAHRDIVEAHVRLLHAAGLDPERMFVSSACLASAAIEALKGNEERIALVDLASGGIEMLALNGFRVEYSRAVAATYDWSLTGPDAANAAEELGTEVRASLGAYRRESEDGLGVDRLYVCSDWADVTAACETLEAVTGASVARHGLPTRWRRKAPTMWRPCRSSPWAPPWPLRSVPPLLSVSSPSRFSGNAGAPESAVTSSKRVRWPRPLFCHWRFSSPGRLSAKSLPWGTRKAHGRGQAHRRERAASEGATQPVAATRGPHGNGRSTPGAALRPYAGRGINITHLSFVHGKSLSLRGAPRARAT